MEATKKAKPSCGDAISNLPDDLLCRILSSLSTKEAALTSVLSKRWSNLLLSIPIFDFDDTVFLNPQKGRRKNVFFKAFVDRLLSLRVETSSPVQRVSLKCRQGGVAPDCITKWILTTILLAFPSLQSLRIHESNEWKFWNGSASSTRTLKSLVYRRDSDCCAPKPCVSFDTPSLVYLEYTDVVADKYENLKLDSLVEAKIDFNLTAFQIMRKPNSSGFVSGDVTTFFKAIRNVKILCLSPDALEALYYRGKMIPVFNNLRSLSLGSDKPHGSTFIFWKLLPSMLNNSPNLETLIIKGLVHYVAKGWEDLRPISRLCFSWDDVSASFSSSAVEVLEITRYKGTCQEVNKMKHFLGKLSRLQMVKVHHKAVNDEEKSRLMKDVLLLPKASKCKIQFMKETV
ncbi:PREDICTED: F-box protein At3g59150-like isoform X2 [Camelina sativa]|uniref:F-box protein At3g59150-like isoform X2 n=1 Tax=Camelina sativa TaxID=90675 RepID=A0ABM1Q849_CAMSA|nr:PREDICTED: F-box protein At3g59150-like isoform X2 [Camelina sativa]